MAEDKIYRAEQARVLLGNDLFAEAITEVRMDALKALGDIDPANFKEICRLQAIAKCTEEVVAKLQAAITASGVRDGGQSLTATRPKANTAN